ncbi:MAG: tRNA threonylcarbamoyladenosine dehydratase [Lentisphaeria bacterium]|nr:MAG: tRNA threonylcarbamoyladenosine dehydratase [Lentisphaeria bacterium]
MNESENLSRFERTRLLLGKEKLERFRRAHVLVLGVGGVGAYAAEQLARAGIGTLTLVDGDRFELTNCNRQLPALTSTLGRPKAEVVAERMREINPAGNYFPRVEFLQGDGIDRLLETRFDFAVDAIDSLTPKVEFLLGCLRRNIPVVSSMGSGGKVDPSLIQVADISKTHGCALARAVRTRLRAAGVTRGIRTVFSPEAVPPEAVLAWKDEAGHHHSTVGTVSYLPAIFGCVCASVVLRAL